MGSQTTKMIFPPGYVCRYDEQVMRLANMMGRKKPNVRPGGKGSLQWDDPEYVILEAGVTSEMAEVGLCLGSYEKHSAAEVAKKLGKSEDYCHEQLMKLAVYGACFVNRVEGVDLFWTETWIPGTMEMIVNNMDNIEKYPIVAYAMEAYGRVRGPLSSGAFPVGVGLMRVIPIESAIDGESRKAGYEEISKYLNENDLFSVSNCSCRTDREVMGEGCGHLKEDMCIQMGHAAEYYIRTGRGRQITREEAFAILKRAEENGLMHEIPNTDGPGHTHAICNCCGCGCLSMRTATMFKNVDMIRSNYRAVVDREKCVACGRCVENCPVNALKLGQKLCSSTPVVTDITTRITPRDEVWEEDKWNEEYRTNRENVVDSGTAPCKTNCPAHIGVQGYIKLAAQGRYQEALELIRLENPLPAVCGRICNRRCEQACTRGEVDSPVAIDEIKKYVAQLELDPATRKIPEKRHDYSDKKIAVIGSGPAGLSCAYFLALDGYQVTIFEKEEKPGGMLTLGIPGFRLEKAVVEAEIQIIRELGVEFRMGVEVGKDVTLTQLRQEGYRGFYVAIGASGGRKLGILGEEAEGVFTGIDCLKRINRGDVVDLSGNTIVIGGGNVAVDAARAAARLSQGEVRMYCLESREEMPASEEEIQEALEEGIHICNGYGPVRIAESGGKVEGVLFQKCLSVFDEAGRFAPVFDETDTILVPADHVVVTVGQSIQWGDLLEGTKAELRRNNTIVADALTYQTGEADVFAGGDCCSGPGFAIDAIAAGKQGAISLHRFVQNGQSLVIGRDRRIYKELDKKGAVLEEYDRTPRQRPDNLDGVGHRSFADGRGVLTEEQIQKETARCLGCGATMVDEYMCVGCGQCTTKCKFDAIHLERVYDGAGVEFTEMKPVVIKQMVKRKGKIAFKKIKKKFGAV
ncbi:FAD-dependent oxidoreductase [Clostridiaceae bacterium 68-1-5]|uniref:FAD-dependent oxidoreductase n=1 Tax=Suipraeoptans intestinalis TaxID=2606628 RepID=A0A6N7V5Q9_9FIRM|nr:FAD-dependent oxidoreductase [Suipraeoptans intestinalis]MDY3121281.1 FAD-dependent oxidoreductase [Suipraeoptans intestinalis]MSR94522.1 FAD-dependent oxidoreductase [Suipraeoptans intestinalis]